MVQPQMEALEQWTELAAAEAVVMLKQLYADSVSIHTDTDRSSLQWRTSKTHAMVRSSV